MPLTSCAVALLYKYANRYSHSLTACKLIEPILELSAFSTDQWRFSCEFFNSVDIVRYWRILHRLVKL